MLYCLSHQESPSTLKTRGAELARGLGRPGDRRPGWVRMPRQPLLPVADVPTGSPLAAPGREQEDRSVTGELCSAELWGPPPGQLPAWAHSREEVGTQRVQQGPQCGLCLSGKEGYSSSLVGGRELSTSPALRPASWPPIKALKAGLSARVSLLHLQASRRHCLPV